MQINAQTKIAALLKHHPDALETIVTLSPDFKKLRNPFLRKLMAGRTSIAMAAKVGGCTPEDFYNALAPLGFSFDGKEVNDNEETEPTKVLPDFLKHLQSHQIIAFDVRTIIAEGKDPLRLIQQKVKELKQGEALKIINSFEPVPLIKLLEQQGFQTYLDTISPDLVETYFYITDTVVVTETSPENIGNSDDWDIILHKFDNNLESIDVRHLEMPMPMMTILEALEKLPDNKALYVHHKRIPVFLLTELRDRNFDYRIKEVQEGEVFLLIFKNK